MYPGQPGGFQTSDFSDCDFVQLALAGVFVLLGGAEEEVGREGGVGARELCSRGPHCSGLFFPTASRLEPEAKLGMLGVLLCVWETEPSTIVPDGENVDTAK